MTLRPEGKTANVEQSLFDYIQANLVSTEGINVHWPNVMNQLVTTQYVSVAYLLGLRRRFGRQLGQGVSGNMSMGLINVNLAEKVEGRTDMYSLATLRDKVMTYFMEGAAIPLKDYDTGGNPEIGKIMVGATRENLIDEGRTSGVTVRNLSIEIEYVEAWT